MVYCFGVTTVPFSLNHSGSCTICCQQCWSEFDTRWTALRIPTSQHYPMEWWGIILGDIGGFSKWNPGSLSAWQKTKCWTGSDFWIHKFRNKNHFKITFVKVILICEFTNSEIRISSTFRYFCQAVTLLGFHCEKPVMFISRCHYFRVSVPRWSTNYKQWLSFSIRFRESWRISTELNQQNPNKLLSSFLLTKADTPCNLGFKTFDTIKFSNFCLRHSFHQFKQWKMIL